MSALAQLQSLSPAVQGHLACALAALVLGPLVLWSRKGSPLHRRAGYLWVALMLGAATTSVFIRDYRLPNIAGFTPIHLFTVITFTGIGGAMVAVLRGRITAHRRAMQQVYIGGCLVAGAFTLLPGRFLGGLLWRDLLGWV
jgi:uncharacterized membrane protein